MLSSKSSLLDHPEEKASPSSRTKAVASAAFDEFEGGLRRNLKARHVQMIAIVRRLYYLQSIVVEILRGVPSREERLEVSKQLGARSSGGREARGLVVETSSHHHLTSAAGLFLGSGGALAVGGPLGILLGCVLGSAIDSWALVQSASLPLRTCAHVPRSQIHGDGTHLLLHE